MENVIGRRFGLLKVIGFGSPKIYGKKQILKTVVAICDCGTTKTYVFRDVKRGHTKSCGCLKNKMVAELTRSHSLSKSPLYNVWYGMKERCYNKKHKSYLGYGGRGIGVCPEWANSAKCFLEWALSNGWEHGLYIDRIDNDKGYNPDNCRFISPAESAKNKLNSIMIEWRGVKKHVTEWATQENLTVGAIQRRVNDLGWTIDEALSTPLRKNLKK